MNKTNTLLRTRKVTSRSVPKHIAQSWQETMTVISRVWRTQGHISHTSYILSSLETPELVVMLRGDIRAMAFCGGDEHFTLPFRSRFNFVVFGRDCGGRGCRSRSSKFEKYLPRVEERDLSIRLPAACGWSHTIRARHLYR
jgi:hypothetical protein